VWRAGASGRRRNRSRPSLRRIKRKETGQNARVQKHEQTEQETHTHTHTHTQKERKGKENLRTLSQKTEGKKHSKTQYSYFRTSMPSGAVISTFPAPTSAQLVDSTVPPLSWYDFTMARRVSSSASA
jgi:hypothetical protein